MGVLSLDDGFVFIHVPKTAGRSLAQVLQTRGPRFASMPDLIDASGDRAGIRHPNHLRARDVAAWLGPETWARLHSFGLVRNPWDRMVSIYAFARQHRPHARHAEARAVDFRGFVEASGRQDLRPQSEWLCDAAGELMVSEVFRFEDLATAYPTILRRCGIGEPGAMPHENVSKRTADYRGFYDNALAERVREAFAEDIERFGYSF